MNFIPECRLLTLADKEAAAQVLAQSFYDDPLIAYMLPRKKSRLQALLRFFRFYGEINIKNGRGYGVGEPLQGVAYWQFPDQADLSIGLKSLGKLFPLLFTQYPLGYYKASRPNGILPQTEALHKKYANELHFYLDNLGVLPSAQGKGYSSKLILPMLAEADRQGVSVYTDTVTQANVSYYEHFGFECVEACPVAGSGITIFAMRRGKK